MSQRHWPEAIASFFVVGLGQVIKGEGEKGLRLILLFYFVFPTLASVTLMLNAYLFIATLSLMIMCAVFLWFYNIWDAYSR